MSRRHEDLVGYMTDFELRAKLANLKGPGDWLLLPPSSGRALIQEVLDHRTEHTPQADDYDPVTQTYQVRLREVAMQLAKVYGKTPDQSFDEWLVPFLVDHVTHLENELAVAQGDESTAPEGWARAQSQGTWYRQTPEGTWEIRDACDEAPYNAGFVRMGECHFRRVPAVECRSIYRTMLAIEDTINKQEAHHE